MLRCKLPKRFCKALKTFCIAAVIASLSGCYEASEPLIQNGEYVAISGSHTCTSKIDGRASRYQFTEEKAGWIPFFHTYTYRDDHREVMAFKALHDGLYLTQVKSDQDPLFKFFFAKFFPTGIVLYAPNLMQQSALLDSWMRETGAKVNSTGPDHIRLVGDADKSLAFLAKHELAALTVIAECTKNES